MSFPKSFTKNCLVPEPSLRIVSRIEDFSLDRIEAGVVFVFAAWSASSIVSWREFNKAVAKTDLTGKTVVVIDIEQLSPSMAVLWFGEVVHGIGEAFWVKNGRVVHAIKGCEATDAKEVIRYTENLNS